MGRSEAGAVTQINDAYDEGKITAAQAAALTEALKKGKIAEMFK